MLIQDNLLYVSNIVVVGVITKTLMILKSIIRGDNMYLYFILIKLNKILLKKARKKTFSFSSSFDQAGPLGDNFM